jgi:hypothetical protein
MLTKIILTCPQREKPRLHRGFSVYENRSKLRHSILRCADGHLQCLKLGQADGGDVLIFEDDVVPVEQWESRMTYGIGRIREETPAPDPFMFSLYATAHGGLPFAKERPFTLPESVQDWGQQAMYYTREMIPIAVRLIEAFLLTPLRRIPGWEKGFDGFDFLLYKSCRLLRIPLYYWPLVQHDHRVKSVAQCPGHKSPLLPEVNAGDDVPVDQVLDPVDVDGQK